VYLFACMSVYMPIYCSLIQQLLQCFDDQTVMSICVTDVFQELIDKAMDDYELIEEFYYNLSTDDFNAKYVSFCRLLFLPSP